MHPSFTVQLEHKNYHHTPTINSVPRSRQPSVILRRGHDVEHTWPAFRVVGTISQGFAGVRPLRLLRLCNHSWAFPGTSSCVAKWDLKSDHLFSQPSRSAAVTTPESPRQSLVQCSRCCSSPLATLLHGIGAVINCCSKRCPVLIRLNAG